MQISRKIPRNRPTFPYLLLELRTGASCEVREFPPGPVRFSYHPPWEVDLGSYCPDRRVGTPSAPPLFTLSAEAAVLSVSSQVPLLICGVERKAGTLPLDGSLRYKNLRIRFLGYIEREKAPPVLAPRLERAPQQERAPQRERALQPERAPQQERAPWSRKERRRPARPVLAVLRRRLLQVIAAAACIALAAFLLYRFEGGAGGQPAPELTSVPPSAEPQAMPERHEQALPLAPQVPQPRVHPRPQTARRARVRMIAPGAALPEASVDYLFIHAHPDDESLDFGALIAYVGHSGRSAAVLLLTDGEGGIFSSTYAGVRENLRDLRVAEAAEALSILGASWYIRMGYRNHPYNGTGDFRHPEEILESWGGDAAIAAVAEVVAVFRPRVVVAPDGPSAAREHFEHEATGLLVRHALEHLRRTGGHEIEALLLCVDPRQTEVYSELVPLPRSAVLDRQRAALAAHATQADASYFGLLMVDAFQEEWYFPAAGGGREALLALIRK